ncbi:hypothetical protein JST97_17905 [bacterium]|nr:hypothetical protein [bacterium]
MRISYLPPTTSGRTPSPRPSTPPSPPPQGPDPQDQAQIRSTQKKMWRSLEWASFGGQVVGASMVLAHQGGIGLAIFAASSAGMVYAGYKRQRV